MYALRVKEHADLTRALAGNQAEIARVGAQLSQTALQQIFDNATAADPAAQVQRVRVKS